MRGCLRHLAAASAFAGTAWAAFGQITPTSQWPGAGKSLSPAYTWLYEFPMPIPAVAAPVISKTIDGTQVDFYKTTIKAFKQQVYPNLGPANLVGYNGTSPGATLRVQRGVQTVERYLNYGDLSVAVHLHGSITRSPWDGWASDLIEPNQFKDYYYPNSQNARTLWYHDHANGHTSVDSYYGQTGVHIIYDPVEDYLNLPTGKYDIPIMLMDKIYNSNGDLVSPAGDDFNFFGDIIHCNGQPWPHLRVEPRKYRLRMLNSALSRPFMLYLVNEAGTTESFQVIASDSGLLSAPVSTTTLDLGMGERYEIVVDFAQWANQNITMMNGIALGDIAEYENTNKIMRFIVGSSVSDSSHNSVPSTLVPSPFPPLRTEIDHVFAFQHNQVNWTINGVIFDDVKSRTLARPPAGTVENWEFRYESGPGVHPVHIHLVDFRIISRTGGRGDVLPYESAGLKDVVLMAPGETIQVNAIYGPWNGLYMFHCHNLVHEDHEMMAVFNVTALEELSELGYENVLQYDNPMDPRYLAKDVNSEYFTESYIADTLLPDLVGTGAYADRAQIVSIESAYFKTHPNGESTTTSSAQHGRTFTTRVSQFGEVLPETYVSSATIVTASTSTPAAVTDADAQVHRTTASPAATPTTLLPGVGANGNARTGNGRGFRWAA